MSLPLFIIASFSSLSRIGFYRQRLLVVVTQSYAGVAVALHHHSTSCRRPFTTHSRRALRQASARLSQLSSLATTTTRNRLLDSRTIGLLFVS
jgi:hypothetical protein